MQPTPVDKRPSGSVLSQFTFSRRCSSVHRDGTLTGKLSAVRAAFKAGVTPTKIAKEFGLSQADVRSVIASDKR